MVKGKKTLCLLLQQVHYNKRHLKIFGYASSKTMLIAQQLYEGVGIKNEGTVGLVSYIRTDSVRISDEAFFQAKEFVISNYGEEFFEKERREYKSKGKTQDAHEAIRPTYTDRTPDSIKESLTPEQYKIYKLIWKDFWLAKCHQLFIQQKL